ncbi:hypothetical protein FRC07_001308, partial [Ceratobasidium sp. 392]
MALTPDSIAPATTPSGTLNQRFCPLWTLRSRFQKSTLSSIDVSTSGTWLASASLDLNMIFIDFKTGQLFGVLDFEARYHATSILWASDSRLYVGTSNGRMLSINYHPTSKTPISICTLPLDPFDAPISALALDPVRNFLAIGSRGNTSMFSRPIAESDDSWDLINHIPAPAEGRAGFVTSLGFLGSASAGRQLFIGHAMAGFCMWHAPHDYQRTPFSADRSVCTIGSAAFSADGRFIAIATLDHLVVIYPMSQHGPVINQRRVLQNQEQAGSRPIIPIVLAANSLILKGSTSGRVPILDLQSGLLAPIESGSQEVIRALTTYGDKVIVGLSGAHGQVSQIKCYLDRTSSLSPYTPLQLSNDQPIFEVAIGQLERPDSFVDSVCSRLWKLEKQSKVFLTQTLNRLLAVFISLETWIVLTFIWIFVMVIAMDPPSLPGYEYSGPRVQMTTNTTTAMTTQVSTERAEGKSSSDPRPKYPEFASLITFCGVFVAYRFILWGYWLVACLCILIGALLKALFFVICLVPLGIYSLMTVLPGFLSATICDALPDIP